MQDLVVVLFLIPYMILVVALVFVSIIMTTQDVYFSYKTKDFMRLFILLIVTVLSAIIGWNSI